MTHPSRLVAAVLAGLCIGSSAQAVIVNGIDFGPVGLFSHIETATVASSYVNGAGQVAQSYGVLSTVNGDSSYCADGSANCALYFVTSSTVSATSGNALYFSGTKWTLYYSSSAAIDLLGQDSAANLAYITGLVKWATLKGENGVDQTAAGLVSDRKLTQTLAGASISASGGGLMSVDLADALGDAAAEAFLDASTIPTFVQGGFADIAITDAMNNFLLNPSDLAGAGGDSCLTGAPQVGDWCLIGSTDLRGRTVIASVPAPGSLPLMGLGLGLIGLAATWRRRRATP